MTILPIKKYPEPILRKISEEVKEVTPEIKKLIEEMIETMIKSNGIGLAASQVGVSKRVIVAATQKGPLVFINPKILRKSKETELGEEGCLSFPGLYLKIKRSKWVEVEAIDINGRKIRLGIEEPLSGVMLSRIIQHEIDHLDGILIIDRISFWQRRKIREKLAIKF